MRIESSHRTADQSHPPKALSRRALMCACMLTQILAITISFMAASSSASEAATDIVDKSVKPGDSFYRYANGSWVTNAIVPSGHTSVDTRTEVNQKTHQRVRELVQNAATARAAKGSIEQQVGDYYASFVNQDSIDARKLRPIGSELATISAIRDKHVIAAYLGSTLNVEVDGLDGNADHIFGMWINQGFDDADHNVVHLWQGGLGLPGPTDYTDQAPKAQERRKLYETHIANILQTAGVSDSQNKAAHILALEVRIAQSFAPDSDAAAVFKQNNPWKRADFSLKAPGIDWDAYFASAGLSLQSTFFVWQPTAVVGVSALVASENVDTWKDYLTFHLIEHYALVLPRALALESLAFRNAISPGGQQDRSELAIAATNAALGQAVGQLYTRRYFSPEDKAKAKAMADNLLLAFRGRISNLTWMSDETKKKALTKLAAFRIDIGYPDKWIDYSRLEIIPDDALGNMRRAEAFLRKRNLARLNQPVDPLDWPIEAQIPGAVIMFSPNEEFFSSGILQQPYFDAEGDAASNYGSAGAGMAHEISHSFDELGNIYDDRGRLGKWWTEADSARYHEAAAKLTAQMDAECPLANACVNGKQVLTESVADQAGLLVAHDAYILSLNGKPDTTIGGLTGEQRFFLAFARRWRKIQSEVELRQQLAGDTHQPGEYRSDSVRNIDAWYDAFGVSPGDKLYVKPEDRVRLW